jgi:hypothetical protein
VAAVLALPLMGEARAAATECRPCAVGPSTGKGCIPNGGILVFNSVPPNVPVYWTLFADAQGLASLRRLDGALEAWSDAPDPAVPGFPGRREGESFVGEPGSVGGTVRRGRVRAVARYADGATCRFRATLAFGFGGARPNRFACLDASGAVISQGRLDLQGIRLRGCRRRPATRPMGGA